MNKKTILLVDNVRKFESKHGGECYEIKLLSFEAEKPKIFITYVDPGNRNFKHWTDIIENPNDGFLISGLKIKKKNILNADGIPDVERHLDGRQALWDELDNAFGNQKETNLFNRLFGED